MTKKATIEITAIFEVKIYFSLNLFFLLLHFPICFLHKICAFDVINYISMNAHASLDGERNTKSYNEWNKKIEQKQRKIVNDKTKR